MNSVRASISSRSIQEQIDSNAQIVIEGEHDGYKSKGNNCLHRRQWKFSEFSIEIFDEITGKFQTAVAHYHFHPGITSTLENNTVFLTLPSGDSATITVNTGVPVLLKTSWHPAFGDTVVNQKLCIEHVDGEICIQIDWSNKITIEGNNSGSNGTSSGSKEEVFRS